jgi:hypothetical protein
MKIYYNYAIGDFPNEVDFFPEDYFLEPKRYHVDRDFDHARCPAFREYYKNTFTLFQQFPINFVYDSERKYLQTDLRQQSEFDQYFELVPNWLSGESPVIQMKNQFLFWTDEKDVWLEQIPHHSMSEKKIELVCGTFPISVWYRPINIGMILSCEDQQYKIDRGDPLCNVRFTKKGDHDIIFELVKSPIPDDFYKRMTQQHNLSMWHPFRSWKVIKDRLNKKPDSKCPFAFLWK